jgi:hypothetical protein
MRGVCLYSRLGEALPQGGSLEDEKILGQGWSFLSVLERICRIYADSKTVIERRKNRKCTVSHCRIGPIVTSPAELLSRPVRAERKLRRT